jgi:dienelactone hydrolase
MSHHRLLARLGLASLLAGAACGGQGNPNPPATPAPSPTPFPANASCGGCPAFPCTRECLPALAEGGPALRPYSQGTCPVLERGWNRGFGFNHRDFILHVPTTTRGPFGLWFIWHGSGGNAGAFDFLAERFDADGYVLVIPDGQLRYPLDWGMDIRGGDDDLRFFDDVVACVNQQFPVDRRRVHSTGYSVGGVFSAYLMGYRSDTLASFGAWSTGETDQRGRRIVPSPPRPVPGLLYHGGPDDKPDWAGRQGTLALAARMAANGALAIVCDHGVGHVVPGPYDVALGDMWAFLLAHPFGPTAAWATGGLDGRLPDYCAIVS